MAAPTPVLSMAVFCSGGLALDTIADIRQLYQLLNDLPILKMIVGRGHDPADQVSRISLLKFM